MDSKTVVVVSFKNRHSEGIWLVARTLPLARRVIINAILDEIETWNSSRRSSAMAVVRKIEKGDIDALIAHWGEETGTWFSIASNLAVEKSSPSYAERTRRLHLRLRSKA